MSEVDYLTARGWLSHEERVFLHQAAMELDTTYGPPLILEVGAEFGASTVCFAQGCPESIILSLDLWPNDLLQVHREEIAKAGVTNSLQLAGDSRTWGKLWLYVTDLLFIDGGHTYDVARADVENFHGRVRAGGLMVVHDCLGTHPIHREVNQAVTEWKAAPPIGKWEELSPVDTMRVFVRLE